MKEFSEDVTFRGRVRIDGTLDARGDVGLDNDGEIVNPITVRGIPLPTPVKIFRAIVSQSGGDAGLSIDIILEDTIGGEWTSIRESEGIYTLSNNEVTISQEACIYRIANGSNASINKLVGMAYDSGHFQVRTYNDMGTTPADTVLYFAMIEIILYP